MKKILFGMAAVSALAIGAPAAAQYNNGNYQTQGGYYQNQNQGYGAGAALEMRVDQLQARLQAGVQRGTISRQEAVQLRAQLRQLSDIERQYSRNGFTVAERQDLQLRIRNFREQLRYAEGRGNGRFNNQGRYGNQGGYGDQGAYGQYDDRYGQQGRIDRDRDGYDDRDYDRDGRWDDDVQGGYQGQGGYDQRYEQRGYEQPSRGGIGGILGSILGGNAGLRVGQRASGNLYGLPYEYQGQFRDGNGAYYRTDGRNIYQIDARTQTVVRVYQMNR
jgi:hypothetical protein